MAHRFGAHAIACIGLTANLALAAIPDAMHPDFELREVPLAGKYKTMGMGFLSDGRMVIATADNIGGGELFHAKSKECKVLLISGADGSAPSVQEIANTWMQPVGVTIVNDKVYISDRDGFYEVNSLTPTQAELTGNRTKIIAWPDTTTWAYGKTWHQFVFDPVYYQGSFYAPYSGSTRPGGPSDAPASTSYSGAFLKWDLTSKILNRWAGGLLSPNGMNVAPNGDMFVADNQGSWSPASTFSHIKQGRFYGHKQSPMRDTTGAITKTFAPNFAEALPYERPTAWLEHGSLRASPSQPIYVDKGRFAGDWLLGDVNNPGLVRIALDDVEGTYNGAVFWFGKGFGKSAINRMAWGNDGSLYVGTLLKISGHWPGGDKTPIYRMTAKSTPTAFDMKAVKHLADGVEILFTEAVDPNSIAAANFPVVQYHYTRSESYGGSKGANEPRAVSATELSADGKRVYLKIADLRDDYVTYFKLGEVKSAAGAALWNNECWFTLNKLSTRTWNSALSLADAPKSVSNLDAVVRSRLTPAGVLVIIDLPDVAHAALRSLSGATVGAASGKGALLLPTQGLSRGLYLLEVRRGAQKLIRPISLSQGNL